MHKDKKRPAPKETYADCLEYLSTDAERKGFHHIATTLKEACMKIYNSSKRSANDNIKSHH